MLIVPLRDRKAKPTEDPKAIDAAQQLYLGGFGHKPYVSGVGNNGYGPMQYTTILAVIAWQLAEGRQLMRRGRPI